jgi:hypothetical protein
MQWSHPASELTSDREMFMRQVRASRCVATAGTLAFCLVPSLATAQQLNVPASDRARGAERVVVGRVSSVTPTWRDNDFGDRLIVSVVHVIVDETWKGSSQSAIDVEIEGGTLGDLTLRVSDLDTFVRGDRAVFYLQRNRRGDLIPHRRGLGLQKLDSTGRVYGSTLTLDQIRRDVRAGAAR